MEQIVLEDLECFLHTRVYIHFFFPQNNCLTGVSEKKSLPELKFVSLFPQWVVSQQV